MPSGCVTRGMGRSRLGCASGEAGHTRHILRATRGAAGGHETSPHYDSRTSTSTVIVPAFSNFSSTAIVSPTVSGSFNPMNMT